MMTLDKWLKANGMTQAMFADRIGVPQSTVSRWCNGSLPKPRHISDIADETKGEVGPASWYARKPADEAAA